MKNKKRKYTLKGNKIYTKVNDVFPFTDIKHGEAERCVGKIIYSESINNFAFKHVFCVSSISASGLEVISRIVNDYAKSKYSEVKP